MWDWVVKGLSFFVLSDELTAFLIFSLSSFFSLDWILPFLFYHYLSMGVCFSNRLNFPYYKSLFSFSMGSGRHLDILFLSAGTMHLSGSLFLLGI